MVRVAVEQVSKRYPIEGSLRSAAGQRPALDSVSLTVDDGETVSLVGPSGCGKSTLLRVVAGLETVDAGRVWYGEHDVTAVAPQDRGVGMVFQDYALYPAMKGKGNLAYFFEVHRRSEDEAEQRAREIAATMGVGFDLLLGRLPDTLSGGEKQRVAIGRCIVREPTLFLMDEPICNLDAKLRERTRMEVKRLLRRFGVTTLYVTHDQQEALFMGDRIAVLRDGRIEQAGTFDELYYTPTNLFVATFIGSPPIAVLPVRFDGHGVHCGGFRWSVPAEVAAGLPAGPLRLGVRPEGWRLDPTGGAAVPVTRVEYLPTEQVTLAYGNLAGAAVTVATGEAPTAGETAAGGALWLTPDWDRALFFAADDETTVRTAAVPDFF